MKPTTKQICDILENTELTQWYKELKEANGNHSHEETTVKESYTEFVRTRKLILGNAEKLFDRVSYKKRQTILKHVSQICSNLNICQQNTYNIQACRNHINSIISDTVVIIATLEESHLYLKLLGIQSKNTFEKKLNEIIEAYRQTVEEVQSKKEQLIEIEGIAASIQKIYDKMVSAQEHIEKLKDGADESYTAITNSHTQAETLFQNVSKIKTDAESLLTSIQEYEEDAEKKRLGIDTFSKNIEEYKKIIQDLEDRAKAIISKETIINELIRTAEQALNLKSAEGISAAFASQYKTANNKWIALGWIAGAAICIIGAVAVTIWIAFGNLTADNHGISLITARIVAVAITVTGATFCAKQYIKQKNIAEDYAYKSVLAKSIIAFAERLKEESDENSDIVANYLKKVLDEIHQDPLRKRDMKEEPVSVITISDLIGQLLVHPEKLKELLKLLEETFGKK